MRWCHVLELGCSDCSIIQAQPLLLLLHLAHMDVRVCVCQVGSLWVGVTTRRGPGGP